MTARNRPAVWEPRGETEAEVMPSWNVDWSSSDHELGEITLHRFTVPARIAFDAWQQVHGAPAFGSCRVRRVEPEPSFHDYSFSEDAHEREQVEAQIAKSKASKLAVQKT